MVIEKSAFNIKVSFGKGFLVQVVWLVTEIARLPKQRLFDNSNVPFRLKEIAVQHASILEWRAGKLDLSLRTESTRKKEKDCAISLS